MNILCIDPGPLKSGVVVFDGKKVIYTCADMDNEELLENFFFDEFDSCDLMVIEMVASYGMAVGAMIFDTCVWIGRFCQAWGWQYTEYVYRKDVKLHLCNSMRAKSSNIRQAILDKFPATGGGKTPQIGTKKQPGPLYGVTSHAMSALAVGITYYERS